MTNPGETIVLRRDRTSFTSDRGDEVLGSGYRSLEREPIRDLHTVKVAGVSHRREELQSPGFDPGAELALVPEPDNPHDPSAVGVWDFERLHQVGYIPRDLARLIGRRLRRGRVARVISIWEWKQAGSGERVGLEILIAPDSPIELRD